MNNKKIIEVLKSGEFQLEYTDNGVCRLYGKDEDGNTESLHCFDCDTDGYAPKEVILLAKALGGKVTSC